MYDTYSLLTTYYSLKKKRAKRDVRYEHSREDGEVGYVNINDENFKGVELGWSEWWV